MPRFVELTVAFGLISLAAHTIGRWFTSIRLPYITGYLATGALAGSFGLDLISTSAVAELRYVDELSLGVIAFVAGSELHLSDLRGRMRAIGSTAAGIVIVGLALLGVAIFVAVGFVAFASEQTTAERAATAMLGAVVLLALSPPSTIAVIRDLRARGPFTSRTLITTVVMDVVIIVAFAVAGSLAAALLRGGGFDVLFVLVLLIDLSAALGLGLLLGRLLGALLLRPVPRVVRIVAVAGAGWCVFEAARAVGTWSAANLPFEIYIGPVLLCLVTGFAVTNLTPASGAFERLLHDIAPAVYVTFFTLTGLSLELDVLLAVLPVAVLLFVVRMVALAGGTTLGSLLAGSGVRGGGRSWMGFVTQAGIALGLARAAVVQFPELGESFATLIIAVVVLNEVFGPVFLAAALRHAGEVGGGPDRQRLVVLFGIEQGAFAVADKLAAAGWMVRLADIDEQLVGATAAAGRHAVHIGVDRDDDMAPAFGGEVDAVVAMSGDDAVNLVVCRAATERFGVQRAVARVSSFGLAGDFAAAGAIAVDQVSAMVGLLTEAVVSPQAAALVLHTDPGRETVQITVTDERVVGHELRALRLPPEVLIVALDREGYRVTPDGFTSLRAGDRLTLIGPSDGLTEAALRIGY